MSQTRLVIVDVDSIVRLDLRYLLQALGYMVAGEAGDGRSAISLARKLRPDLVLMDIRLSGDRDGIDAAATLTREGIAPVLLLTAFSDIDLAERAANAGVASYLVKPFNEEQLRPAIETALSRYPKFQARVRRQAPGVNSAMCTRWSSGPREY